MPHFPIFLDLKGKPVLVAGGGHVALRKLQKLAPYGGIARVVAPEILPQIKEMPGLRLYERAFRAEDLDPRPELVVAATDDPEQNRIISELCRERHIPVNAVDDPTACTFLFPALAQQGKFSAGISTGGASPAAAVYYKEKLQQMLPEKLEDILDWLGEIRPEWKKTIPDQRERARIFRELFDACMTKGGPLTEAETKAWMQGNPVGSVALVGAGCGKADLITLRGLRLLQQCQAVVYDDLIDPALLEAVPESALRIYVGKRSGVHSASQQEINRILIELARSGRQVVRLKGGDPYLFGRGGEEMLALQAAGISCQEVPGIPSAIGIPAEAGIPVTHRAISRGLHIVTAHTADTADGLPSDFDSLAGLSGTLVFLMGLAQLPRIVRRLMAAGKSGKTPAAVISGGNSPHPVTVRAPLIQLVQAVEEANVSAPAIILVGEVAAMDLSRRPLEGIRVGITGTVRIAEKQQALLEPLGAEVFWVSRSDVCPREEAVDWKELEKTADWLVFTSPNGVGVFWDRLQREAGGTESISGKKFAAIGSATAEALKAFGISADLCPETFTSEALARELAAAADRNETIFLLRSSMASPVLPEILRASGFQIREIPVYDLETADESVPALPELDYLTFSSAGGAALFFRQYGAVPRETKCVCIGPITAEALAQQGENTCLRAPEISAAGIVGAILTDRI